MEFVLNVFPVFLFLIFLFLLDSFKLVQKKYLLVAIIWGFCSAAIAFYMHSFILNNTSLSFKTLSKYLAPASEEIIKLSVIILFIAKKRIGFMIDAAIYGFAVGTGFALIENILYMQTVMDHNLITGLIRGFGTAIMHGGCTSLFAVVLIGGISRNSSKLLYGFTALLLAYIIHSAFNHFYVNPIIQTIGIILILPVLFIAIFRYNEKQLQDWLEIEFNSEIELLNMIKKGKFQSTRAGEYLSALKKRFSPEDILDMYCFIQIYLELSIKAKRNVMLKENGFPIIIEEDIKDKLIELTQLKKQIGKVGEMALSPLIKMSYRDLWKLNTLK